jgi:hypothetical protein
MSRCLARHGAETIGPRAASSLDGVAVGRRLRSITPNTLGVVFADKHKVWVAVAQNRDAESRIDAALESLRVMVAKLQGFPQADEITITQDGAAVIWQLGDVSLANSRTLATCLHASTSSTGA